jgi:hypothetical protein
MARRNAFDSLWRAAGSEHLSEHPACHDDRGLAERFLSVLTGCTGHAYPMGAFLMLRLAS